MSVTSSPRSSSAMASGFADAALRTVSPGRNEDLPVTAQEMCVHAQGLMTTRGGQGPRDDGPVPVAFCMPRWHRHPELHCFRRSIPRLYAPLSTLRVLPHGSDPRTTRGQCGSLLLHCNGLSPSTSCRSSRRTAAQYLARGLPCERFTAALAGRTSCITRGRGGWLGLPRGGLSPPILCQLPRALRVGSNASVQRCPRDIRFPPESLPQANSSTAGGLIRLPDRNSAGASADRTHRDLRADAQAGERPDEGS